MRAPVVVARIQPRHVMSSRMKGHDAQEAARLAHAAVEDAINTATMLGREVVLEVWVREVDEALTGAASEGRVKT